MGNRLRQDDDVLDTWFSSGLWPFSTMGWPDDTPDLKSFYPTSLLITGFDILFFWVARMIMLGIEMAGDVPFRQVFIHGLVRDADKQKMSKTKGNVINPLDVFDKYGTDAARFALTAASTAGLTLSLQESKLESARNFANRIWNATRFVLLNCDDVLDTQGGAPLDWETGIAPPELADQWILSRLNRVAIEVRGALAEFRFHEAASTLYHFFWDDFCDWYAEAIKPRLYTNDEAAIATAHGALERLLALLHPVMPHVTEEIWSQFHDTRLIVSPWPEPDTDTAGDARALDEVQRAAATFRRSGVLVPLEGEEKRIFDAVVKPERSKANGDVDAERERLRKEIARAEGMLANERFVANAPPELVEAERDKLARFRRDLEALGE